MKGKNSRRAICPRTRAKIFQRDNFTCRSCGVTKDFTALECDHIVPRAKGGSDEYDNLQTLCWECNNRKKGKSIDLDNSVQFDWSIRNDPREFLSKVKEKLQVYSDLTWNEFKVVFNIDSLFFKSALTLDSVKDLFFDVKGIKRDPTRSSNLKSKLERDRAVLWIRENTDLTINQVAKIIGCAENTIDNIIARYRDQKLEVMKGGEI